MGLSFYLVGFWVFVGAMMSAESPAMTPRIRRELPGTFLGRLLFSWLMPGPATGLVFAMGTFCVAVLAVHLMLWQLVTSSGAPWIRNLLDQHRIVMVLVASYLMFGLVCVRGIVAFLRTRNPVKVPVGLAAMTVVLLMMVLIPYSIELHLNDYRQFLYSSWQFTNWIWTIEQGAAGSLDPLVMYLVLVLGSVAFLMHLLLLGKRVLPQRLATPDRVQEEYRRMAGLQPITAEEIDPLGLGIEDAKP
jgi:hypothetical protein